MTQVDHLEHLAADAAAVADVLRTGDLDTAVPGCPDWVLRDLAVHLRGVHRWVATVVRAGEAVPMQDDPVEDERLAQAVARSAVELCEVLSATDPEQAGWTLAGPGTAAFWRRRMALETAVHRVDAERAAGLERDVPAALAEDGIAEVLEVIHPRQVRLGRAEPPTRSVELVSSTGRSWRFGDGARCATLHGRPSDLLLLLWRRTPRTAAGFAVEGDADALDALLGAALTP